MKKSIFAMSILSLSAIIMGAGCFSSKTDSMETVTESSGTKEAFIERRTENPPEPPVNIPPPTPVEIDEE